MIGGFLVKRLLDEGHQVRAVDIKPLAEWWQIWPDAANIDRFDLADYHNCRTACYKVNEVYDLACLMGGIFWIETERLACMRSVLIGINLLEASRVQKVERFFFSSSACVYNADKQRDTEATALREEDAYPALCEDGYGWEKLFIERLAHHYQEETDLETRVGRYHNVYSPHCSWTGGKEKSPAAVCRKVAEASLLGHDSIEIWGDGEQTRSFCFVDDCVEGTLRLMRSDHPEPVNIGSDRLISINDLVALVQEIAGTNLRVEHIDGPLGVRGRNSDNTLCREVLGWEPSISLEEGMAKTYSWIYDQVKATIPS